MKPVLSGPHAGKTGLPGPGSWATGTLFLTDQRGFASKLDASARIRTQVVIEFNGDDTISILPQNSTSAGTIAVGGNGQVVCSASVNGSGIRDRQLQTELQSASWRTLREGRSSVIWGATLRSTASVGNHCAIPNFAQTDLAQSSVPRIDFDVEVNMQQVGRGGIQFNVTPRVDEYPAFEAYAEILSQTGEKKTVTLFQQRPLTSSPLNLFEGTANPWGVHLVDLGTKHQIIQIGVPTDDSQENHHGPAPESEASPAAPPVSERRIEIELGPLRLRF